MRFLRDCRLSAPSAGLRVALEKEADREPATITFVVTLSGVALAGVGSALRGAVAGALALAVQHGRRPQTA